MAMGFDGGNQMIAINPLDRFFACGIDISNDYAICIIEAGGELIEQGLQPCVAMGLHNGNDTGLG